MVFSSKANATDSKGKLKKGFKSITDKKGNVRYLTESKPMKVDKKVPKEKVKKDKKDKVKKVSKDVIDEEPVDETQFVVEAIES